MTAASETSIYLIDDGASHVVIAANEEDASAIYRATDGAGTEHDPEDPPTIEPVTRERAERMRFWEDDPGNTVRSIWAEYERDPSPRYVGGSEY